MNESIRLKFEYKPDALLEGMIEYASNDRAITLNAGTGPFTMPAAWLIVSHYLQLGVSISDRRLIYINGYCPREGWKWSDVEFQLPNTEKGALYLETEDELEQEDVYHTALYAADPVHYEPSGCLVIGAVDEADQIIEIANDTFVGLRGRELTCLVFKLGVVQTT